jgi:hypothetical protein
MSDIVRVLRIYEFVGPREAVERQVSNSIHGERRFNIADLTGENRSVRGYVRIRAATIGTYPEILDSA